MKRCHICDRQREPDETYFVAMRNHLYVDACWSCWMKWPDDHKRFPPVGFGRWTDDEKTQSDPDLIVSASDVRDLVPETA